MQSRKVRQCVRASTAAILLVVKCLKRINPDKIAPQERSDLELHCLLEPSCSNVYGNYGTVKPVLSGHSKRPKIFLRQIIAYCMSKVLQNAPFGAFCNTFDLL